jgi:hypothetical protein
LLYWKGDYKQNLLSLALSSTKSVEERGFSNLMQ